MLFLEQYGILKVTKEQYETLDKEAILKTQKKPMAMPALQTIETITWKIIHR